MENLNENKVNYLSISEENKIKVLEYLSKSWRIGFLCELNHFIVKLKQIEKIFNYKIWYDNNLDESIINKLIETWFIKEEDESNFWEISEYISKIRVKEIIWIQNFVFENEILNESKFISFLKKLMLSYNSIIAFELHRENRRNILEENFNLIDWPFSKDFDILEWRMAWDWYWLETMYVILYDLLKDFISFRDIWSNEKRWMTKNQLELFKLKDSLKRDKFENYFWKIDFENIELFMIYSYVNNFESNNKLYLGEYWVSEFFKILIKIFWKFFVFKNYWLDKLWPQSNNRRKEYIDYSKIIEKESNEMNYKRFMSYKYDENYKIQFFIDLEKLNENNW